MADTELEVALEEVKKKPRYYAIIYQGSTIVKMIVQQKRIKMGDIQYAKTEFGGSASIEGTCSREGTALTLQVLGEAPTLNPMKVKEFIALETGLPLKPKWQVVKELKELEDEQVNASGAKVEAKKPATGQPASGATVEANDVKGGDQGAQARNGTKTDELSSGADSGQDRAVETGEAGTGE